MLTSLGLVSVILLLLVLIYLNYRKKIVIQRTAAQLCKAEARYRLLFEQSPISLWEEDLSEVKNYIDDLLARGVTDLNRYFDEYPDELRRCADMIKVVDINRRTMELYEMGSKSELGSIADILPIGSEWIIKQEILDLLEKGHFEVTVENRTLSGRELTIELRAVIAAGSEESWHKIYASVIDITEQTQLKQEKQEYEKQLLKSQKLEAIGSLAGGIAHDFNNLLAPMMGRAELMLLELDQENESYDHCKLILDAGKRARELVRQILTFSREVDQEIKPVCMRSLILEVVKLIRPTLPSTIELKLALADELPYVMADATQMHQVIMNLATNAFQAMTEDGGTITFVLEEVELSPNRQAGSLASGRYLQMQVKDTGHGMDRAIMDKIFDPYFSTKPRGKGTGLGLSVVHGILQAFGGRVDVESESGEGTVFTVLLPVAERRRPKVRRREEDSIVHGKEHILLVDDDKSVAEVTAHMLRRLGYTVTMRVSSLEALEAYRQLSENFDLVITDLTMPHITGLELYSELKKINPDVPVVICTGFSEHIEETLVGEGFLSKPVLIHELSHAVRDALDRKP